ncbi:hypothetical protein GCM10018952_75360 [Streptosporangium vulgare]
MSVTLRIVVGRLARGPRAVCSAPLDAGPRAPLGYVTLGKVSFSWAVREGEAPRGTIVSDNTEVVQGDSVMATSEAEKGVRTVLSSAPALTFPTAERRGRFVAALVSRPPAPCARGDGLRDVGGEGQHGGQSTRSSRFAPVAAILSIHLRGGQTV